MDPLTPNEVSVVRAVLAAADANPHGVIMIGNPAIIALCILALERQVLVYEAQALRAELGRRGGYVGG